MTEKDTEEERFFMKPEDIVKLFKAYEVEKAATKNPRIEKATGQKKTRRYEGLPLMERCQLILGKRMKERRGVGYLLDNVPVSCERLLREARLFLYE